MYLGKYKFIRLNLCKISVRAHVSLRLNSRHAHTRKDMGNLKKKGFITQYLKFSMKNTTLIYGAILKGR